MYVYKIINQINKKSYIGITKSIKDRFNYHKTRYNKTSKSEYLKKPLYKAFRKYGIDNFKFIVLYDNLTEEEAKLKEIEMIAKFRTLTHQNGYNISIGGDYSGAFGSSVNTSVLTEEEVTLIYARIENGETIKSIYNDFKHKITYSGFQNAYMKNWTHIEKPKRVLPPGASISKTEIQKIKDICYDEYI